MAIGKGLIDFTWDIQRHDKISDTNNQELSNLSQQVPGLDSLRYSNISRWQEFNRNEQGQFLLARDPIRDDWPGHLCRVFIGNQYNVGTLVTLWNSDIKRKCSVLDLDETDNVVDIHYIASNFINWSLKIWWFLDTHAYVLYNWWVLLPVSPVCL